jgi:lambda family phage portal protein
MQEVKNRRANGFGDRVDDLIGVVSPRWAFKRKRFRFAYDALDKHRTRKKRSLAGGTGDDELTEERLFELREILRDMGRNNPLVKGLLKTERDGLVGSGSKIKARTADEKWNDSAEALWKEEMIDMPCDNTGRLNINRYERLMYLSYRRDGDIGSVFLDNGELQPIEGEMIGNPYGLSDIKSYKVINGIAYSKRTGKIVGYYVGSPGKYGYVKPEGYRMYKANQFWHTFDPERFSNSRGEPALTSSIKWIDRLCDYMDAELVAAKVNACFSMFVATKDEFGSELPSSTNGVEPSGYDADGNRLEKIEPGIIMYGKEGEEAKGIGQVRPGNTFDPFVLRMLTMIGRPLCMPLMLITLDFSGATFMNARIAYQKVQETWTGEQDNIIKPFRSEVWRRWVRLKIKEGKLTERPDAMRHEVFCKRWPYVDPFKEAKADEQQIKNRTTSRTLITMRQGEEQSEIDEQLAIEKNRGEKLGLVAKKDTSGTATEEEREA